MYIYCAECIVQDEGVLEAITQIDGTVFCTKHAKAYAKFKADAAKKCVEEQLALAKVMAELDKEIKEL